MMRTSQTMLVSLLVLVVTQEAVRGAMIVGGGGLLTSPHASQLETWLGEGSLTFTNIYTKAAGDNSFDFHAAVDGKGRTITLIEILAGEGLEEYEISPGSPFFEDVQLPYQIIGGYNPKSWRSDGTFTVSPIDEMDAFLFNLTANEKQNQLTSIQTYNDGQYGPTFGMGGDIYIDITLLGGSFYTSSYGQVNSIIDSPNDGYSVYVNGLVGRIEVYTLQYSDVSAVPEPSSFALFALGVIGLGIIARRRSIVDRLSA